MQQGFPSSLSFRRSLRAVLSWAGRPLFHVVHPAFSLPTTASLTLQGDGYEKTDVACGMPDSCTFPSLDSRHMRLLLAHKEADLAPHSVVVVVL